jgi:hypothetical protein
MINQTQIGLARDLEFKLRAAVAANDALIAFERDNPLSGPRLAYPLSPQQFAQWVEHVAAVAAGARNVDI